MFDINTRTPFTEWFKTLSSEQKVDVRAYINVLKELGPQLSRPYADTVNGSKHKNMKELRVQSGGKPLRIFFAFDPNRTGIILCGGDKSNDKRFYKTMLKIADKEFSDHLKGE